MNIARLLKVHTDSPRLSSTSIFPDSIPHCFNNRPHQIEAEIKSSSAIQLMHIHHLVSTAFTRYSSSESSLTLHRLEDVLGRAMSIAQSLYQCYLSCNDAFPPPQIRDDWARAVWSEACARVTTNPIPQPLAQLASLSFWLRFCTASHHRLVSKQQHESHHRYKDEDNAFHRKLLLL